MSAYLGWERETAMQLQYGTTIASHGQLWLSVLHVHAVQVGEGQEGAGVES